MDELKLDLGGIQDPVTARVTDLIRLGEALENTTVDESQRALKIAQALVLDDLKQIVSPVMIHGDNVIPFPGGRDVH